MYKKGTGNDKQRKDACRNFSQAISSAYKLILELAFRKADGTPYEPCDKEKKAMLLFRGGDDMKDLYEHVGADTDIDTFDAAVTKIRKGLQGRTNVVQRNLLLASYPQGTKSFERWSKEINNAAKL